MGTNDEEAPSCYTPPFRLALSMGGVAIGNIVTCESCEIKLGRRAI